MQLHAELPALHWTMLLVAHGAASWVLSCLCLASSVRAVHAAVLMSYLLLLSKQTRCFWHCTHFVDMLSVLSYRAQQRVLSMYALTKPQSRKGVLKVQASGSWDQAGLAV